PGLTLGPVPGHPAVRALSGDTQLLGDMGNRATIPDNTLDQQQPPVERQTGITVGHETSRCQWLTSQSPPHLEVSYVIKAPRRLSPTSWPGTTRARAQPGPARSTPRPARSTRPSARAGPGARAT